MMSIGLRRDMGGEEPLGLEAQRRIGDQSGFEPRFASSFSSCLR